MNQADTNIEIQAESVGENPNEGKASSTLENSASSIGPGANTVDEPDGKLKDGHKVVVTISTVIACTKGG